MSTEVPSARMPALIGIAALVLLIGSALFWAGQTSLSGGIMSSGVLEPTEGRRAVSHPTGGVVADIFVSEGETVEAGALMMRFDDTLIAVRLNVAQRSKRFLEAQIDRLRAQLAGAEQLAFRNALQIAARQDPELDARLELEARQFARWKKLSEYAIRNEVSATRRLRQQVEALSLAIRSTRRAENAVAEELAHVNSLLAGGLSRLPDALALRREAAELEARRAGLLAKRAEELRRLEGVRQAQEKAQLDDELDMTRELAAAERQAFDVGNEIAQLTFVQAQHSLFAPISGKVLGNRVVDTGAFLGPGEPLLYLVPTEAPRVVSTRVPSRDISAIRTGQKVLLRFVGADPDGIGEFTGTVRRISADAHAQAEDAPAFIGVEITVALEDISPALGKRLDQAGQPVDVIFRTPDQPVLAYLLAPVHQYFARAMREPRM